MSTACGCGAQGSSSTLTCSWPRGAQTWLLGTAAGSADSSFDAEFLRLEGEPSRSRPGKDCCFERDAIDLSVYQQQYRINRMQNTILSGSLTRSNPLSKLDLGRFSPSFRHAKWRYSHDRRAVCIRLSLRR